jgi:hypothetical protein
MYIHISFDKTILALLAASWNNCPGIDAAMCGEGGMDIRIDTQICNARPPFPSFSCKTPLPAPRSGGGNYIHVAGCPTPVVHCW